MAVFAPLIENMKTIIITIIASMAVAFGNTLPPVSESTTNQVELCCDLEKHNEQLH